MSLMLEALRKAERQARTGAANEPERADPRGVSSVGELALEPETETASDAPSRETEAPQAVPAAAEAEAPALRNAAAAVQAGERFPRPFVLVLGLLGVLALGATVLFWIQLRPPPAVTKAKPTRPAAAVTVASADSLPADSPIPGLPAPMAVRAIESAAPVPRAPSSLLGREPTVPAPSGATRLGAAPGAPPAKASRERTDVARIHSQVESGYAAFQAGELGAARAAYEQALREEPGNRDALLGLAVLEIHAQRFDLAEAHYASLLQASPRDPYALAGLLALRAERVDPLQAESSLKTLLAAEPDAALLHFSLGNQFARQARWAEAQQAYARALTGDPGNPDVAFNLAVSLDRLHRTAEALEQYALALQLAERRIASFSPQVARLRLQQLAR